MHTLPDAHVQSLAETCVNEMGDIFWDYDEPRDAPRDYKDPGQVATVAVASTLHAFATTLESNSIYTNSLRLEYREIINRAGENATDSDVVASLKSDAAWTEEGARTVLRLAQLYGTSILQNALALAEALNIEDGEAGF